MAIGRCFRGLLLASAAALLVAPPDAMVVRGQSDAPTDEAQEVRRPRPVMPEPLAGTASVPFSIAGPVSGRDRRLTVLTNRRGCGVWQEDLPVSVHVSETVSDVWVRVDAVVGPDGRPCKSTELVRVPVDLSVPLRILGAPGRRTIRDAATTAGVPALVNGFEAFDTGFRYSCAFGENALVTDMAGPGLELTDKDAVSPLAEARAIHESGDLLVWMGSVSPTGLVDLGAAMFSDGRWSQLHDRCRPRAVMVEGIDAATWMLRGRRPLPQDRFVRIWVQEEVCNGSPIRPRVVRPIIQLHDDAFVIVMATTRYPTDPPDRTAQGPAGRYAFVDCPGMPAVPYIVDLPFELRGRTLYDGGLFPPRLRWGRAR